MSFRSGDSDPAKFLAIVGRTFWVPEAPDYPGLYANLSDREQGKLAAGLAISTTDVHIARKFATKDECRVWCAANPVPVFVPREHGFAEPPVAAGRQGGRI